MLCLSPAVSVNDVPSGFTKNNYILFPDSADKDLYYALAERPNFLPDAHGNPSFNLTWYFGSGVTPGGICTMTVALPVPDMSKADVADRIAAALTSDASTVKVARTIDSLCRAMQAGQADQVKALKAELGYSDDAANQKKAAFDASRDYAQFLPAAGNIKISPVPFKTGSVTVQAFAAPELYVAGTPSASTGKLQTTPSSMNSNAAVVTFNLQEIGAKLFWQGMGGPPLDPKNQPSGYDAKGGNSVISVTYEVGFDALLPQAKATVTLDHSVVAKLDIEEQIRVGAWGTTYREQVARGKQYTDTVNSATEIVLPAVASKDDKESVSKLLTDWAASQLEDMLKAQMPTVKLEDLNIDSARQLQTVNKQSRTYSLTQAVTVPKLPQAQLPKVGALIPADKAGDFFQLINLNERPYFNVDVTVRPPSVAFLKERRVDRFVATQISYAGDRLRDGAGNEVATLEYVTGEAQKLSTTLRGTFDKRSADTGLTFGYIVAYDDGTPSFHGVATRQDGSDNYLDLGGIDLGVLHITLDGIDLPWDVVSSATVDLSYGDWTKRITLKRGDPPALVVKPFGREMTGSVGYQLTLNLTAGAPVVGPVRRVPLTRGNAEIALASPIGDAIYTIDFALGSDVSKAQLRMEYALPDSGANRVFSNMVTLDGARPDTATAQWKVPARRGANATFRITKARITANGTTKDLIDLGSGTIDPLTDSAPLTVEADGFSTF